MRKIDQWYISIFVLSLIVAISQLYEYRITIIEIILFGIISGQNRRDFLYLKLIKLSYKDFFKYKLFRITAILPLILVSIFNIINSNVFKLIFLIAVTMIFTHGFHIHRQKTEEIIDSTLLGLLIVFISYSPFLATAQNADYNQTPFEAIYICWFIVSVYMIIKNYKIIGRVKYENLS